MNLIAAILPLPRKLREPEHGGPSHVRLVPAFLQGDAGTCVLEVCNLFRRLKAAGYLSIFPLDQACKQASGSIFQAFSLSPVLSFVPVFHAHNKAWSNQHGAHGNQASSASGA